MASFWFLCWTTSKSAEPFFLRLKDEKFKNLSLEVIKIAKWHVSSEVFTYWFRVFTKLWPHGVNFFALGKLRWLRKILKFLIGMPWNFIQSSQILETSSKPSECIPKAPNLKYLQKMVRMGSTFPKVFQIDYTSAHIFYNDKMS